MQRNPPERNSAVSMAFSNQEEEKQPKKMRRRVPVSKFIQSEFLRKDKASQIIVSIGLNIAVPRRASQRPCRKKNLQVLVPNLLPLLF
jgi:hypothetical protein